VLSTLIHIQNKNVFHNYENSTMHSQVHRCHSSKLLVRDWCSCSVLGRRHRPAEHQTCLCYEVKRVLLLRLLMLGNGEEKTIYYLPGRLHLNLNSPLTWETLVP